MNQHNFRTRSLGGTLLVIKAMNDCVTIERDEMGKPEIVSIEGEWTAGELEASKQEWNGSDAQRR